MGVMGSPVQFGGISCRSERVARDVCVKSSLRLNTSTAESLKVEFVIKTIV